ncbi:MAG: ATP-binding cassette domain-containing protein [Betaproteobacteria bacterium]|nr:ATP-binding cassette domain-containing protein [Betaproteobacteria bacterium]
MSELDSTAKKLLGYARQEWRMLLLSFVIFALAGAVEPAIPALFKKLIDSGFQGELDYPIWLVPPIIIGLFLLRGALNYCGTYIVQAALGRIVLEFRLQLMAALFKVRSDIFSSLTPGQVVNKIINDPFWASQILGSTLINLVKDTTILLCLLGYLLYLNWQLTLISFVSMPLLAIAVRKAQKRLERVGQAQYESQQRLIDIVDDNARAWRVVRTFGATDFEGRRFEHEAQRLRRLSNKQMATGALVTPITQLVAAIGVSAIVTLALYQASQGGSTVGEFVSFIMALLMTISPMRHLSDVFQPIAGALVAARGAFDLLEAPSELDAGTRDLDRCQGDIRFDQVTVQFSGASLPALNGLNIHVKPGTTVALVGASGAGKTTMVNSLLRFVAVESGQIRLDGVPISEIRLSSLRKHFAVVSQDIVLFDGTVAQNVAYASDHVIDREHVQACLHAANLWSHVNELPLGMDSLVGVNGSLLSGGQRQRLAIARALYRDSKIWIFDEATSALDTESENLIQKSIESLRYGRTIIIIAHRLSTVRHADAICVMSAGQIIEQGSHDVLMALGGKYFEMVRLQS